MRINYPIIGHSSKINNTTRWWAEAVDFPTFYAINNTFREAASELEMLLQDHIKLLHDTGGVIPAGTPMSVVVTDEKNADCLFCTLVVEIEDMFVSQDDLEELMKITGRLRRKIKTKGVNYVK